MSLLYSNANYDSHYEFVSSPLATPLPATYPKQEDLNRSAFEKTQLRIRQLANLLTDWDGFNSPAPSANAISNADRNAALLMIPLLHLHDFVTPHISATGSGEITFEWWKNNKKLTLYFTENSAEYLKSWGTDLDNEMEHDNFRGEEFSSLYFWLING